jgi:hypothetical protein
MTNFLFWNVNGNSMPRQIATVCRENEIDVLILAEHPPDIVPLLIAVNAGGGQMYTTPPFDPSPNLIFMTRYPPGSLTPVYDGNGVSIRQLRPPLGIAVLLAAMHLPSKLYASSKANAPCGDPPPLKWSDLRYVFDIQEDCNGKEAIQA